MCQSVEETWLESLGLGSRLYDLKVDDHEIHRNRVLIRDCQTRGTNSNDLEIASRRSVSPDRTWLKRDIQSIMVDTNIPLWGGGTSVYGSNLY